MKDEIEKFLETGSGNGSGCDSVNGNDSGYGYGYSSGSGNGSGYGNGYGNGNGNGYCSGNGNGSGYGSGYGYSSGDGNGSGYGSGYGNGNGIAEFNGMKVYNVDGVPTIIESVHGNYAKGFTIKYNSILVPCWIARVENSFAHGKTLHDAVRDANEKAKQTKPVEVHIADVVKKYNLDDVVSNRELFTLHHLLTGSCEFGRKQFCEQHNIDLEGSMTIKNFIAITRKDYGGEIICELEKAYMRK